MGNLQVNLDKTYDSIPCKDASNAKEVVAAIKNAEDEVKKEAEDKKLSDSEM